MTTLTPDTAEHQARLLHLANEILTPPERVPVSEWCSNNLTIPPPTGPGRISWHGYEYLREPLDAFNTPGVSTLVLCFGSQSGKTTLVMAGAAWSICQDPSTIVWAMPNEVLARSFSTTRFMPMVEASPALASRIPGGPERRTRYTTMQQALGASLLTFIGSNSPANTTSRPSRKVVLDEVDKLGGETDGEADAVEQLEQRTKAQPMPFVVKTSTPTDTGGRIWQDMMKGDVRRYTLPCPLCSKRFALAWSRKFTVFGVNSVPTGYVQWDPGCRRKDGTWDLDRVEVSTWVECPHCHGKVADGQKSRMVRGGLWVPTASTTAARGMRSYHLSSLYALSPKTAWGALAVRFLQAKSSIGGVKGFMQGDLAEPWEDQDTRSERLEVVAAADAEPLPDAVPILTADHQATGARFWYVVRAWMAGGHSRLLAQGSCETWEDLREIQTKHGVQDRCVGIDSGHAASDVYENCLRFGVLKPGTHGMAMHVGWTPMKGREKEARWKDKKTGQPKPYCVESAALPHKRFRLPLIEFNGEFLLDVLVKLRRGPGDAGGFRWELSDGVADDEYYRHLDAKVKRGMPTGRTGRIEHRWVLRNQRWPDHLLDCELMQLPMAMVQKRFPWAAVAGVKQ